MATQAETNSQNTVPRNIGIGIYQSRDSLRGLGIPKASPDDCCELGSKFCVAEEAGLAQLGLEHPALFDELSPPRVRRIFRTVYRITRNREDAEDAMQDAFLQALVHFEDCDRRSAFTTWFMRIAINCSLMILRKRKDGRTVSLDEAAKCEESKTLQEARDPVPDPEKGYVQTEQATALRDAINELRPSLRIAIELRHFAERSIKETAQTLAVSLGATKARLFRARAALRKSRKLLRFHNTDLKANWSCQTTSRWRPSCNRRYVKHG